jgi:hypothetical protein
MAFGVHAGTVTKVSDDGKSVTVDFDDGTNETYDLSLPVDEAHLRLRANEHNRKVALVLRAVLYIRSYTAPQTGARRCIGAIAGQ